MTEKKNPFAKDPEAREAALRESVEPTEEKPKEAEASEEKPAEEEAEAAPDPFAEEEEPQKAEADGDDGDDGDEDDESAAKKSSVRVPKSRLDKVIAQREEMKAELAKAQEKLAALAAYETILEGRYQGNINLAKYDHDFASAAERLSKAGDEAVNAVLARIDAEAKSPFKPTQAQPVPAEAAKAPEVPAAVAKIIKKDARAVVAEVMDAGQIDDSFAKVITSFILDQPVDELADLDQAAVVDATKEYLDKHGLQLAQIRKKTKDGAVPKNGPPVGGKSKSTSKPAAESEAKAAKAAEKPKNHKEWMAQRQERLRETARELGLE